MRSILIASAMTLLVMGGAAAEPLDSAFAPSAQFRYEMKFGGPTTTANAQSLRFAAGLARPASNDASTMQDRMVTSAHTAPLISVIDTGYSFGSHASDLHLAGIDLGKRDTDPALDVAGERSWWANNWGWVVVAGIAAVTIVAVTAIHEGTKEDNNPYGNIPDGGTDDGGDDPDSCSGTPSVQIGGECFHGP